MDHLAVVGQRLELAVAVLASRAEVIALDEHICTNVRPVGLQVGRVDLHPRQAKALDGAGCWVAASSL